MSKKTKGAVFFRAFLRAVIVIVVMIAVGFASYHVVFWYCKHSHDKVNGKTEQDKNSVVYTAVMFDDTMSSGMEGIMVRAFHPKTKNTDFIMVPSNTEIPASSDIYGVLKEKGEVLPEPMTIGVITSYVSSETERYELTTQALEEILGIKNISYYEAYDQKAFVSIVNLLEPQIMEIPMTITTKDTNGADLTLEQGAQSLDGEKACALLSFKGYSNGVIDQAKMMAQFFSQYYKTATALSEEEKKEFYEKYYQLVTCNQGEKLMSQYKAAFLKATDKQFHFTIVPRTETGTQIAKDEMAVLIDQIETTQEPYETEQDLTEFYVAPVSSSKNLVTKIYNGTRVEGLATEWVQKLRADGYNIIGAANDNNTEKQNAVIYVKTEGAGLDLKAYFPGAEIVTDPTLDGIDIKVVLGLAQAHS